MNKIKLLIASLLLSALTMFVPTVGLAFPMQLTSSVTRGFPVAFLEFSNPAAYESLRSFFQWENFLSVNVNGLNYLLNTLICFIILFLFSKLFSKKKKPARHAH
ncbi:hypothetical protein [Marinilactibacillus kalidii]|uniref:hypothetical protein n=1 Tax=Marinilactibacillus kalidii TaxID=2820274 RepID=UPI001ABE4B0B|nr:hypothetical protein [Marinilactibacillus kalidii]